MFNMRWFMFTTELIFLVVVILNITAMRFIVRGFFRKDKVSGKNSTWGTVTRIFSVIFNIALGVGAFWGIALGFFCMSPFGWFGNVREKLYFSDLVSGLLLCEISVFVPYGLNVLLYKFWYKKLGLSKWWTFPALVIGTVAFIILVSDILSENFIHYWSQTEWIWR